MTIFSRKLIAVTLGAASLAALGSLSMSAPAAARPPSAGVTEMKGSGPEHGDCKATAENAVANSHAGAQQLWAANVSGKYGKKWALWVGAKDKAVVPLGGNSYQASAKPCFYQPVL